ncbi:MAG: hypothetical protein JKY80_02220 [Mariprofundaceae bacterium]|nr:hypothetical protein [Mariprofundaceae bacterium]
MIELKLEQLDANSEHSVLVKWNYSDYDVVSKDDVICMVETSKAVVDVLSPASGVLIQSVAEGDDVCTGDVLAIIGESQDEAASAKKDLESLDTQRNDDNKVANNQGSGIAEGVLNITQKAQKIIKANDISPDVFNDKTLVTAQDVEKYIKNNIVTQPTVQNMSNDKCNRVLIVTARIGGMQVLDILLNNPLVRVIGFVDDDPSLAETHVWGIPVIGTFKEIKSLWKNKKFDSAIIGFSSNVEIRKKLFDKCVSLGIPMTNAIDPSVRMNRACALGQGNIICSHVHLGIETVLGDNNFISANSSIDHHNKWGDNILLGPNCVTSGFVEIENEVRLGTGVFVQPQLKIGQGSIISSGAVLTTSVPSQHIVKVKYSQFVKAI